MIDAILVVNAGSSSIKFNVFDLTERGLAGSYKGIVDAIGVKPVLKVKAPDGAVIHEEEFDIASRHESLFESLMVFLKAKLTDRHLIATGHRVVHGGDKMVKPVEIGDETVRYLDERVSLAPLHMPHNVSPIKVLRRLYPDLRQVACFDTAFHRTMPPITLEFPIAARYTAKGIIRYGFHGLSYEYILASLGSHFPEAGAPKRTVVAHLGNGASVCGALEGKSMTTSMGFTALDGLMMGTRSGAVDPSIVFHLQRVEGLSVDEVDHLLNKESGLLGVSGISADMRPLEDAALSSDWEKRFSSGQRAAAQKALDMYVLRVAEEVASAAAVLEGLDALVFTAGVGENSRFVRRGVMKRLAFMGIVEDPQANEENKPFITTRNSGVHVLVLPTNEELVIARHTQALVS